MPDFRPLPEIDRDISVLRRACAAGTAAFGSAARLVALEEERAAVAEVACPKCGGSAVYSGPASLARRGGKDPGQPVFEDRLRCRLCAGTGLRRGLKTG